VTVNRILLDEKLHAEFLAQGRKDPYTKEPLLAGMEIVICANCKRAFDAATWSGECPGDHGTRTLREIPTEEFPSHFDRNARPQPSNITPSWIIGGGILSFIIVGGIALIVVIGLMMIASNQSSTSNPITAPILGISSKTSNYQTASPNVGNYSTTSPNVGSCYRWDQVTVSMAGQVVCVYGTIYKITNYKPGHNRFFFTSQPNSFFMYSSVAGDFIHNSGGGVAPGDCMRKTAEIQVNAGIPSMDVGNSFQSCP
jgi:hypothetical protein